MIWWWGLLICMVTAAAVWFARLYLVSRDGLGGPAPHFLVGNVPDILRNMRTLHHLIFQGHLRYGPLYRTWLFQHPVVNVASPEALREVLVTDYDAYDRNELECARFGEFLGGGLILQRNGPEWRRSRQFLEPFFGHAGMRRHVPVFSRFAESFCDRLDRAVGQGGAELDAEREVQKLTFDVIGYIAVGVHWNTLEDQCGHYAQAWQDILEHLMTRFFVPLPTRILWWRSRGQKKYDEAMKLLTSTIDRLIDERTLELQRREIPGGGHRRSTSDTLYRSSLEDLVDDDELEDSEEEDYEDEDEKEVENNHPPNTNQPERSSAKRAHPWKVKEMEEMDDPVDPEENFGSERGTLARTTPCSDEPKADDVMLVGGTQSANWPPESSEDTSEGSVEERSKRSSEDETRKRADSVGFRRARRVDVLSYMIRMRLRDPQAASWLTREHIRAEILTLLFAGHDTTTTAVAWALHYLALYPEIQQRARAEVLRELNARNINVHCPTLSHGAVSALRYTRAVFLETLRLQPSAPLRGRTVTRPVRLAGRCPLSAGSTVAWSAYSVHHHPDVWVDPERFLPDRFLPSQATSEADKKRGPCSFVAFGAGPRRCLGEAMAVAEATAVLAHVLLRFRLALAPSQRAAEEERLQHVPRDLFSKQHSAAEDAAIRHAGYSPDSIDAPNRAAVRHQLFMESYSPNEDLVLTLRTAHGLPLLVSRLSSLELDLLDVH